MSSVLESSTVPAVRSPRRSAVAQVSAAEEMAVPVSVAALLGLDTPAPAARASTGEEREATTIATVLAGLDRAWHTSGGDAWDQDTPVPEPLLQGLAQAGLFAASLERDHGGLGLSVASQLAITEWVARRSPSLGVVLGVQSGLALRSLLVGGARTQVQHQRWLAPLAWGHAWGCYALTEPDRGSDAQHIQTEARPTAPNTWELWGEKFWIGNAHRADVAIVFAQVRPRTEAGDEPTGMTAFVVPTDRPGWHVPAVFDKLGIRGSTQGWIRLEGLIVTAEDVLGEIGQGFRIATLALNTGRLTLGTGAVAGMEEMLSLAARRLHDREQFGAPLLERPSLRDRTDALACRALGLRAFQQGVALQAATAAHPKDWAVEAAALKVAASDGLWEASDWALQVWGGRGFCKEWPIERAWRDARINRIFEGANEALTTWIGFQVAQTLGRHVRHQSMVNAVLRLSSWGRGRAAASVARPYAAQWGEDAAVRLEQGLERWLRDVGRLMRLGAKAKDRPAPSDGATSSAGTPVSADLHLQRVERLAARVGAQTIELLIAISLRGSDSADAADESLHRLAQLQLKGPRRTEARDGRARTRLAQLADRYTPAWGAAQRAQRPAMSHNSVRDPEIIKKSSVEN